MTIVLLLSEAIVRQLVEVLQELAKPGWLGIGKGIGENLGRIISVCCEKQIGRDPMWCPRCGSSQRDYGAALRASPLANWWRTREWLEDLTFCKECGANLYAVRQVVGTNEKSTKSLTGTRPGWLRWLQSSEEAVRRQQALEIASGLTPEVKRYNEIKGGIITGSVGVALMIFLYVFMQGIIIGGKVPNDTAEILSRIWVAGVIPVFVGLALIFNGVFISKKALASSKRAPNSTSELTGDETPALRSANAAEFLPPNFSVTENTTRHLNQKEESR